MDIKTISTEAYSRATSGQSLMNYPAIYQGFIELGIPESEIRPRENVLTFWAWKAAGRRVRKGVHGVKACTFVPVAGKVAADSTPTSEDGKRKHGFSMPRTVTVFHISQTEPEPQAGELFA